MKSYFKRVVDNASWLIICRISQSLLSLFISMYTARYLGPSNFGLINYAASIVAFLAPVMKLGFDSILVQKFVEEPEKDGKIIGTSLILNCCSAVLCMLGMFAFVAVANAGEKSTIIVCILYSIVLLAQAIEMICYWFQSKLLSKYVAVTSLVVYFFVSLYKIWLLSTGKNVYWFAVSNAIDYLLIGIVLYIFYFKLSGSKISFSSVLAEEMLSKGKYYILSGLMVTVFSQTDRIMLKMMVGDSAVGFYSAAVVCASVTSFVFSALIESMRPVILEGKKLSTEIYESRVKQLYMLIIYGSLLQSVAISILAGAIIHILYGEQYAPAVPCLQVIVWYTTFSYYGGAKDIWILAEEKQKYLLLINASGAVMNVCLNLLLIPLFGIVGASVASLFTQFFTNILMGFIIKPLRKNNMLLLQSICPSNFKQMWRILRK